METEPSSCSRGVSESSSWFASDLPAKDHELLTARTSVWRPLADVDDWPLALCDGKSIAYDDLLEVDLIRKDYIGYTMYATYRSGYKWYFLDRQKPYEVCLFKNFDSDTTVDAQSTRGTPPSLHQYEGLNRLTHRR